MSTIAKKTTRYTVRVVPRSLLLCKEQGEWPGHATIAANYDEDWRRNKENVALLKQARYETNSDKFKKICEVGDQGFSKPMAFLAFSA
jgi:hypothetical protein